jgi:cytochrome P450
MTFKSTADLPYLNAVIEEGLRLYPPFVGTLTRVSPPGGEMVDGYFVPEGVSAFCIMYNWPNEDSLMRFIDGRRN